jgi:hypothetical protein
MDTRMPQIIKICDAGKVNLPINGQLFSLALVIIRVSENESAPVDYIAYRNLPSERKSHESTMP